MSDLSILLDDATADAKKRGHGVVTPAHLAVVMNGKYSAEVATAWQPNVVTDAEALLASLPVTYDSPIVLPETEALRDELRTGDVPTILTAVAVAVEASSLPVPGDVTATGLAIPQAHADWTSIVAADDSIIGRDDVVLQILDAIDRKSPRPVLLVGAEGSGRTSVGAALAGALDARGLKVVRVDSEVAAAQSRNAAITEMLRLAQGKGVVMIDDIEIALGLGYPGGFNGNLLDSLRASMADASSHLLAVVATSYLARLQGTDRELVDEFELVELPPLPVDTLHAVVQTRAVDIATFHGVTIGDDVVSAALASRENGDVDDHPSLALRRIDVAAVRAARRGAQQPVVVTDLPLTAPVIRRVDPAELAGRLRPEVVGQDAAIERITSRLAITVAELDLNPHRPDGVFLFAGPTGVGKTALALALAEKLFGSSDAIVRIDMSELHSEHTTAKLVGAPPGYIGYDNPDGLLTTQILKKPRCVLLLDEIEKADPQVWNTFLQVFDAGRLTDLRGTTADFREVVIVMTTNLGAEVFSATGKPGFIDTSQSAGADTAAVMDVLKRTMRPELLNRIDEILVFSPLSAEAVRAIAAMRTEAAMQTLHSRGYDVSATPELLGAIERVGFSREYGGRQVLRTVERLVLEPLAALPPGAYTCVVEGDAVGWVGV